MALTVWNLLREKASDFRLEVVSGSEGLNRAVTVSEINRPGLALGGFFQNFRSERIQIIGRGEYSYLTKVVLSKHPSETLKEFFSFKIPCIILTHGLKPPEELVQMSNQAHVPLIVSGLETASLVGELSAYLEEKVAPTTTVHGVLVEVYGLGVLISGDSGIGKSECALELVKRGHLLVSDDLVLLQHRSGGILIGRAANDMMRYHMEVRGLGIIDVKQLFGVSSILDFSRIELVIQLEMWDATREYDRLGMEDHSVEILGVRVPRLVVPVRPGRNLAILIEIAALHQRLKARGINTAHEMEKNLVQFLSQQTIQSAPSAAPAVPPATAAAPAAAPQDQPPQTPPPARSGREGHGRPFYRRR